MLWIMFWIMTFKYSENLELVFLPWFYGIWLSLIPLILQFPVNVWLNWHLQS